MPPQDGNTYLAQTMKHVEEFGMTGLRTLVLTATEIAERDWDEWNVKWQDARKSLVNREKLMAEVRNKTRLFFVKLEVVL